MSTKKINTIPNTSIARIRDARRLPVRLPAVTVCANCMFIAVNAVEPSVLDSTGRGPKA